MQSHDCKPIVAEPQVISAKAELSGARRAAGEGDMAIELLTVFEFAVNQKIAKWLDINNAPKQPREGLDALRCTENANERKLHTVVLSSGLVSSGPEKFFIF